MPSFQYTGEHQAITLEGVYFVKDNPTEVDNNQLKTLQASGFWQPMLDKGEIVAVEAKDKPKTATKASVVKTTAKADEAK